MTEALDRREFEVALDPSRAETLPARAFTDPAVLDLELERIFARAWLPVPETAGESRSVAEACERRGDRLPFRLLGKPLFVQRDWKGKLRVFPNVCTHAWHTLVEGAGRERFVVCPQHGRQFECDGSFRLQPGFASGPGFPRACDDLRALPAERLGPQLLTCLGKPLQSFARTFAWLKRDSAKLGFESWKRVPQAVEVREVAGNWKLHVWNYMDRFHIGFVHRAPGGLADAIELPSYRTEIKGGAALQWAWAARAEDGFHPKLLPARFRSAAGRRVFALWWLIFPNLALNFYPWGLSVNLWQPVPGAPERTQFLWYHWVRDPGRYRERDRRWLSAAVDAEDVHALDRVAEGARSGFAPRGRFAAGEETGPHWFHRRVYQHLFEMPETEASPRS